MPRWIATRLSVNLNKVALLRNQRDVGYPSVTAAAKTVIAAGAHGITVHPRPDERHIRLGDVHDLKALLADSAYASIEYNIEGYPSDDFLALIDTVRPHQVTLVPDSPEQRTSDHGWNIEAHRERLVPIIARLQAIGTRVSLFVDPDIEAVRGASSVGADRIELYTEPYAAAFVRGDYETELSAYAACAVAAEKAGLGVNAGHDLNIANTRVLRQALPNLAEVSIGHAITADALEMGFAAAVRAYLEALAH